MSENSSVDGLLSQLDLKEKFGLLAGKSLFKTRAIPKLNLPAMKLVDGPRGVGFHCALKRCTAFPTGIALGASWDVELAEQFGQALASEAIAVGGHIVLGPAVNICRTPLNGRTFEYLTEDPFLNSRMAVPVIQGIQSQGVGACIKHYAAHNQETNRTQFIAEIGERALREIYLPVYEAAVREADVWSVMAAYSGVNGEACCENHNLLTERLREEWGFTGVVMSDWLAAKRTRSAASCLKAGLNLEMPLGGTRYRVSNLKREYASGAFTEQDVDEVLKPLLRIWQRVATGPAKQGERNSKAHQQLAYKMAVESITLLKNERQQLPLKSGQPDGKPLRIAVLGPRANKRNCRPLYGGSAGVWSPYEITPYQGIAEGLPEGIELIDSAAQADVAVLFVGYGHKIRGDCEGHDRPDLKLPAEQEQLIRDTAAVNPNTVVVLVTGSPIQMDWLDEVSAVVAAWYPGMEGGRAIADILFGRMNPSGKLPVSYPCSLADSPAHASKRQYPGEDDATVFYAEGVFVGYRHYDRQKLKVLFPFGHGLSYTVFSYRELNVASHWLAGEALAVSVTIENCGDCEGAEVLQCYIAPQNPAVERPPQELKAFRKVLLKPGETRRVEFLLTERDLAYWCESNQQWWSDPGIYEIRVGSSSRDIRQSALVKYQ